MGSSVNLPPGFELDSPHPSALPPGFELDKDQTEKPGFFSSLWEKANPISVVKGIAQTLSTDPRKTLKAWYEQSKELHDKATDAAAQGDYQGAAVHGINFIANVIPGLGKAMDDAAEAKTPEEFKAKLGGAVGSALALKEIQVGARAVPAVVKAVPSIVEAAPTIGRATAEAAKAGGRNMAVGTMKVGTALGAGYIAEQIAGPSASIATEVGLGPTLIRSGVSQMGKGFQAGYAALKQSLADSRAAAAPEPPMAGAVPVPKPEAANVPRGTQSPVPGEPVPGEIKLPEASKELFGTLSPKKGQGTAETAHPEGVYPIPAAERTEAGAVAPKESYVRAAQTTKARALARYLRLGQIPVEDVQSMTPDQWKMAAEGAAVNMPSEVTIKQALGELKNLYADKGAIKIDQALQEGNPAKADFYVKKVIESGPLSKNPKALEIAQRLQKEMNK